MINKIKKQPRKIPVSLRKDILSCKKCFLSTVRRKNRTPVIGRGSIPADILFIGEGPGVSEELMGIPFIGMAGTLLDKMLLSALDMSVSYYITNCVLCRPTDIKNGQNRPPNITEVLKCKQHVLNIYDIVKPKIVVFVGRVAEKYYKSEFVDTMFIYHPAFLLRGGGEKHPNYLSELRKLEELKTYLKTND